MRMLTHAVFTAGLLTFLLSRVIPPTAGFALGVVVSVLVNYVIDELGHDSGGGMSVRSLLTHSVFTAPMWGAGVAYLVWLAGSMLGLVGPGLEWVVVVSGVVAAYSHLLLDSVTEGGVYSFDERVAIAHFRASNPLLNLAFIVVGFLLFVL